MADLTKSELQIAAKNRAWEVVRQWRRLSVDDETFAAMVTKAVMGDADSAYVWLLDRMGRSDG